MPQDVSKCVPPLIVTGLPAALISSDGTLLLQKRPRALD